MMIVVRDFGFEHDEYDYTVYECEQYSKIIFDWTVRFYQYRHFIFISVFQFR